MQGKRNYKDSLFRNIFKDKKRLCSLYNALSGENISPRDITINTLRGTFYNDVKNDISFDIGNHTVVLMEHQIMESQYAVKNVMVYWQAV